MSKYAVHKAGFFFTDEFYTQGVAEGTVVHITHDVEEARQLKKQLDLQSLRNLRGRFTIDSFFDYSEITDEQEARFKKIYQEEFNLDNIEGEIPKNANDEQLQALLSVAPEVIWFHVVVEYDEDAEVTAYSSSDAEDYDKDELDELIEF